MLDSYLFRNHNNWKLFFYVLGFSIVSIYLSYRYVGFYQSLMAVILISLAVAYPFIRMLKKEEMMEERTARKIGEENLLKRHWNEIGSYLVFFISVFTGFLLMSYVLPSEFFTPQNEIINILSGKFASSDFFELILTNNLKVFFVTFLISFFIAAGMIFVLVWNASIFGVFLFKTTSSLIHVPIYVLGFVPHGFFEISAYILAGLSGSLLSHEFEHIRNKKYRKFVFPHVLKDVVILFLIGVVFVFFGALIEAI